jgi:hypothetical protein
MKQLLLIFIFFPLYSQTADFKGHVVEKHPDSHDFPGVIVKLIQNEKIAYQTQTDINGNFILKNVDFGNYEFKLSYVGYPDLHIKEFYFQTENRIFEFTFPDCKKSVRKCPKNHSDRLIPIVYGFPSEKMMKASKKGKIILGGCVVTGCDPKWHCKKHNISF